MLQTTRKSVAEVAYAVGFQDAGYFSKCFKRTVGVSSRRYVARCTPVSRRYSPSAYLGWRAPANASQARSDFATRLSTM